MSSICSLDHELAAATWFGRIFNIKWDMKKALSFLNVSAFTMLSCVLSWRFSAAGCHYRHCLTFEIRYMRCKMHKRLGIRAPVGPPW